MAEGFAHELGKGLIEPYSAGLMAVGVNHHAIAVMKEIGINISGQRSKEIDRNTVMQMNYVITLCDHAELTCPRTPWTIQRLHWPIADPVGTRGSEEYVMHEFRRARDEIKKYLVDFIDEIKMVNKE
jgi:arsenate reductase